jgi:DNA gyrase inhibitor GyrI
MENTPVSPLAVSIRNVPATHVVYVHCAPAEGGDPGAAIRTAFDTVKEWVQQRGLDLRTLLHVGVIHTAGGQFSGYDCCIEIPDSIREAPAPFAIQELVGGRYAVLTIEKDPAIIGPTIGRFYQEYVPQHGLALDGGRPAYEVYFDRTMEYCVPLDEPAPRST